MKRPAFQFYPGDWQRDAALRSCSVGARGLWIEMMCVMHQAEPYGFLVLNGKPILLPQLARMVGATEKEVVRWLKELEDAAVYSADDGGRIFSRRMVRDEGVRNVRAAGGEAGAEHGIKGKEYGKLGGRPKKEKGADKPPSKRAPSSSVFGLQSSPSGSKEPSDQIVTDGAAARRPRPVPKTGETWQAYTAAYLQRYSTEPVRNATVNAQMARFVERVGSEDAPAIAAFYVGHNQAFYLRKQHAVGQLMQDAEGLAVQWRTNRKVTDTEARQADRTAATGSQVERLLDENRKAA